MHTFRFRDADYAVFALEIQPTPELSSFSHSELAVARLLASGMSYAEIARRRRRSVHTVGKQAGRIFRKLAVKDRFELARVLRVTRTYPSR